MHFNAFEMHSNLNTFREMLFPECIQGNAFPLNAFRGNVFISEALKLECIFPSARLKDSLASVRSRIVFAWNEIHIWCC